MREGEGNCLKYLKREWNRTKVRGNKRGRGQAGSRGGCLKKRGGGAGTPLRTMQMLLDKSIHPRKIWIVASRKKYFSYLICYCFKPFALVLVILPTSSNCFLQR